VTDRVELQLRAHGLAGPQAPARRARAETAAGWQHALALANDAIPRLAADLRACGARALGRDSEWQLDLDQPALDATSAAVGLPLVGALAPAVPLVAAQLRFRVLLPPHGVPLQRIYTRMSELVLEEVMLWNTAARLGAATMPYPFRRRSVEWFWHPAARYCICLRCGTHLTTRRDGHHEPRCNHCMKETPKQREWPPRALMPAGRGKWWLTCRHDGCGQIIEGTSRRRYCDRHRTTAVTASRRL
jgi:hypothetical protein